MLKTASKFLIAQFVLCKIDDGPIFDPTSKFVIKEPNIKTFILDDVDIVQMNDHNYTYEKPLIRLEGETMGGYSKRWHDYYGIQFNMTAKTAKIDNRECMRTQAVLETYSQTGKDVFQEYCIRGLNFDEEYEKYSFIIYIFILVVILLMLILIIFIVGFYKVLGNLFYVFSGHWLL